MMKLLCLIKSLLDTTKFNIKTFSAYPEKIKLNTICIEEPGLLKKWLIKDPARPKTDPVLSLLEALSPKKGKFKKTLKVLRFLWIRHNDKTSTNDGWNE